MIFVIITILAYLIVGIAIFLVGTIEDIQNARDFPYSEDDRSLFRKITFPLEIILGWGFVLVWVFFYNLLFENIIEHRWFKRLIQTIINVDSMVIEEVVR